VGAGRRLDVVAEDALTAYDKIIGLDLSEAAVDGSQHKPPRGGEGTGPNPVDRGKRGWKWSLLTDRVGVPFGWATDGTQRHDVARFGPTLKAGERRGLVAYRPCTSTAAMTAQEYGVWELGDPRRLQLRPRRDGGCNGLFASCNRRIRFCTMLHERGCRD
jgi:hypothetical protein